MDPSNKEDRPDPEALLSAWKEEERKKASGKMKVFFGMSAGVGKTYSMLEDAQQRLKEGINVVIGIIETHGRKETAKLLEGLTVIPPKKTEYRHTVFEELDLEAILKKKPQIVLVDELAHTNVPGSRHPKRWQDVFEILDAGINVYTTLNVQHVESRKDAVEGITGIVIHETVPDVVLERASEIELVDISAADLLKRLAEGKVYIGPQSEIAARNFFKEDRLTALREIALRLTAEKVEHDLRGMMYGKTLPEGWRTAERFMVVIDETSDSQHLIRTARRLAFHYDAYLCAIYVDTGRVLDEEEKISLAKNLALVRNLGAEVITTTDPDMVVAIQRNARSNNITQIIIGRQPNHFLSDLFKGGSVIERLSEENTDTDLLVVRMSTPIPERKRHWTLISFTSPITAYIRCFLLIVLTSILNGLLLPYISSQAVGYVFLIMILFLGLFNSIGPMLFSAALSGVIWYIFFLSPFGGFTTDNRQDITIFLIYLMTAVVTGVLTYRIHRRENLLRQRMERSRAIYEIVKEVATAPSMDQLIKSIKIRLDYLLDGNTSIVVKNVEDQLQFDPNDPIYLDEKERAVAMWTIQEGKEAGVSTDTLPSVRYLYLPLKGYNEIVGLLAFSPNAKKLQTEDINILYTASQQLGYYIERALNEEKSRKSEFISQIDNIYRAILNSILMDSRAPHNVLKQVIEPIKKGNLSKTIEDAHLVEEDKIITDTSDETKDSRHDALSRIVDSVLDMSWLSLGFQNIKLQNQFIPELLKICVENVSNNLRDKHVLMRVSEDLPSVPLDSGMMEILICNLLLNAIERSPSGSTIEMGASIKEDKLVIYVLDESEGIPDEVLDVVFKKFDFNYEGPYQGLVLGLAVAKKIAEMHGGRLDVFNRREKGIIISVFIPVKMQGPKIKYKAVK
jgi:two-component system sensor histidine kinase KdpD